MIYLRKAETESSIYLLNFLRIQTFHFLIFSIQTAKAYN